MAFWAISEFGQSGQFFALSSSALQKILSSKSSHQVDLKISVKYLEEFLKVSKSVETWILVRSSTVRGNYYSLQNLYLYLILKSYATFKVSIVKKYLISSPFNSKILCTFSMNGMTTEQLLKCRLWNKKGALFPVHLFFREGNSTLDVDTSILYGMF